PLERSRGERAWPRRALTVGPEDAASGHRRCPGEPGTDRGGGRPRRGRTLLRWRAPSPPRGRGGAREVLALERRAARAVAVAACTVRARELRARGLRAWTAQRLSVPARIRGRARGRAALG